MWYKTEVSGDQLFECKTNHLHIDRNTDLEMMAKQCAQDFFDEHVMVGNVSGLLKYIYMKLKTDPKLQKYL